MNLVTDKFFPTVMPSILAGSLLVIPSTMSANTLVNTIPANIISCKSAIDSYYCELMKKIESYRYLNENWDGYGGIAPKEEVIGFAMGIIQELQKHKISAPKGMVSGEGEIALFWKRQNEYIEISLEESNESSYFIKKDNDIFGEENCFIDFKIPDKLFDTLADRSTQNTMSILDRDNISMTETSTTSTTSFLI
jgi:hypothetical protein